jgi:hypothetical protein
MELHAVGIEASPREAGWVRLWGDVRYGNGSADRYWLEVRERDADALSATGDPWLAWLAPLAGTLGERLYVGVPCDPTLLAGVRELLHVWSAWFENIKAVEVIAKQETAVRVGTQTASFFSGGVDSFFTALRYAPVPDAINAERIDVHLLVWGFDIPLCNRTAFERTLASVTEVATALGRDVIPIVTNVRETRFREADWLFVSHGPALAGIAQAVGGRYQNVLIPSSAGYYDLGARGSHPLTDPMMSSARVRVVHDGAAFMRGQKTEFVAHHPLVLRHLRVCYHDESGGNCGQCNKCYRTMLTLEALGALEGSSAFDRRTLDLRRAEHIYCPNEFDVRQFTYIQEIARRNGRADIERAVTQTLRNSAKRKRWVDRVRALRDTPVVWRWAPGWERRLLEGWIT